MAAESQTQVLIPAWQTLPTMSSPYLCSVLPLPPSISHSLSLPFSVYVCMLYLNFFCSVLNTQGCSWHIECTQQRFPGWQARLTGCQWQHMSQHTQLLISSFLFHFFFTCFTDLWFSLKNSSHNTWVQVPLLSLLSLALHGTLGDWYSCD